jgi:hypothetical protein
LQLLLVFKPKWLSIVSKNASRLQVAKKFAGTKKRKDREIVCLFVYGFFLSISMPTMTTARIMAIPMPTIVMV